MAFTVVLTNLRSKSTHIDYVPAGLVCLEISLMLVTGFSVFGTSITFSAIFINNGTQPPNSRFSAQEVRVFVAMAWLFSIIAFVYLTAAYAVFTFHRCAVHGGFGGDVSEDREKIMMDRWHRLVTSFFCKPPLTLML